MHGDLLITMGAGNVLKIGEISFPDKVIHIIHMLINITGCMGMWISSWIMYLHNIFCPRPVKMPVFPVFLSVFVENGFP